MISLNPRHPIRLALGFFIMLRDAAQRLRQPTVLVLADNGARWATQAAAVDGEIVRDAGCGETLVTEVARDGKITPVEAEQLRKAFTEIQTEAREGRVL